MLNTIVKKGMFEKAILGDGGEANLDTFWEAHKGVEWVMDHPFLEETHGCRGAIPINIHFDDVSCGNETEMNIWSWKSVLAQ
eukprot:8734676-Pyramimonas_sp.AAC.1